MQGFDETVVVQDAGAAEEGDSSGAVGTVMDELIDEMSEADELVVTGRLYRELHRMPWNPRRADLQFHCLL